MFSKKIKPYHLAYTKTKTYNSENYSNTIKWTIYNLNKKPTTEELLLYDYGAIPIYDDIF
jgi:hypothetical protein